MEPKKYSSYAEIEHDLEILKLEKEIYYQKMKLSFDKTKESILPSKPMEGFYAVYKKIFSGTFGTILKILIPYAISWFINRKRGD
jgi:hypothetical protein